MPPRGSSRSAADSVVHPVLLVWGDDDFAVKERSRHAFETWCKEVGGDDHETIDAAAANAGDALRALARLREALQTLPFFGSGKVVFFRNCNFLGDDRTAESKAVTEGLADVAALLKTLPWGTLRLVLSAGKVDRRKSFYKTLEKLGRVEACPGLSAEDKDWAARAGVLLERRLEALGKAIAPAAVAELVAAVGPNSRLLDTEAEKIALYVGDRPRIGVEDVRTISVRNRQARAFALAEAVADRNVAGLLRALEDELWGMKFDKTRSEIGLLYGIITKVRTLLLVRELKRERYLRPTEDYRTFQEMLGRIPAEALPADKRFNPLAQHPYVMFRALAQADNYTTPELVRAMELLLECNTRLVSSDADERLVLQHTLVRIATPAGP